MLITTMKTANAMVDRGEVKGKVEEGREETVRNQISKKMTAESKYWKQRK